MKKAHIFVLGRVQGVSFRWWTRNQALSKDLKGWVRNLDDGRVEIVAVGEKEDLYDFAEKLKEGPLFAKVSKVEFKIEMLGKGEVYSGFKIVR